MRSSGNGFVLKSADPVILAEAMGNAYGYEYYQDELKDATVEQSLKKAGLLINSYLH